MTTVKLSLSILITHWCNKAVDWFMKFFEDADMYWTHENRPKQNVDYFKDAKDSLSKSNEIINEEKLIAIINSVLYIANKKLSTAILWFKYKNIRYLRNFIFNYRRQNSFGKLHNWFNAKLISNWLKL